MERGAVLSNADYRLMDIIWEAQPVASPELCRLAEQRLGWKRSTTYTVIKRLRCKGYIKSEETIVSALIGRGQAGRSEGERLLRRSFGGSLSGFVAAFLEAGALSEQEARQIEKLLQAYLSRKRHPVGEAVTGSD